MKTTIRFFRECCLLCIVLLTSQLQGQDVLNTNSNPAFTILGIASSEVQRPSNVGEFTAALQNATQNFSGLPSTFGTEILPYKLLGGAFDNTDNDALKGLTLSFAYKGDNVDPMTNTSFPSIGLGVNIGWGKIEKEVADSKKQERLDANMAYLAWVETDIAKSEPVFKKEEQELKRLRQDADSDKVEEIERYNAGVHTYNETVQSEFETFTATIKENRALLNKAQEKNTTYFPKGFFVNFSLGAVHDFESNQLSNGRWARWGGWIRTGYERFANEVISALVVLRYQSDEALRVDMGGQGIQEMDVSAWDFGARIILETPNKDFSLSSEYVWRNRSEAMIGNSRKWQIQMHANVGGNTRLGFTFGKDFEENIIRDGNLISLLNLVSSFGTGNKG